MAPNYVTPEWYLYSEENKPIMVFNDRTLALQHIQRLPCLLNEAEMRALKNYREATLPPIGQKVIMVRWGINPDRELQRIYGPTPEQVKIIEEEIDGKTK